MPRHLTKEERDRIAQLAHQKVQLQYIAEELGRSPSTISRELRRNATGRQYFAAQAQEKAERRRQERPLERKLDRSETNAFVRKGLAQYWSPDQIAGRLKLEFPDDPDRHVSPQTIYSWIEEQESEMRAYWREFLRRRGKRRRRRNPAKTPDAARIANRPPEVESRERLGDFEGDTMLGPPGTGGVVTLVDRQSRLTIIAKVPTKEADRVHGKIKDRLQELPDDRRGSLTLDNGKEFAHCHRLENHLGVSVYFAEPGRPYQRGTNENTNGLIRQFFPKGTEFRDVTHQEVREVENLLNDRPRACLGYQTPNEVFYA